MSINTQLPALSFLSSSKNYFLIFILGITLSGHAQELEQQFDEILNKQYSATAPGATAIVAKNGKIVYHKAFGMANLELGVPMKADMVFEIGSITKQFTAVAILMLLEQGKLSLEDDITKYIEDYPTYGHTITIHHLLTHTSGIKSYTSLERWHPIWRDDYTPKDFIDFFKDEPMDFAPGEKFSYNNSAYFILGYVIEKASGKTYEEFIENEIFKPLGMHASLYGSQSEIIYNRAYGYQKEDGYVNAEYLSLTQPYAAGSIMSTVEDLYTWNRAIRSNKLVKEETIKLAFTNYTLNNGDKINYGYGWFLDDINDSPTIEHAGGIFGYVTNSIYLPEEDVFVAIFSNCDCNNPKDVSIKMAAIMIDKPIATPVEIALPKTINLEQFIGEYALSPAFSIFISTEEGKLMAQATGQPKIQIFAESSTKFFYKVVDAQIEFIENEKGIYDSLILYQGGQKIPGKRK